MRALTKEELELIRAEWHPDRSGNENPHSGLLIMRMRCLFAAILVGSAMGGLVEAKTPPQGTTVAEKIFVQQEQVPGSQAKEPAARSYRDLGNGDYQGALTALRAADAPYVFEGPRFIYLPQLAYLEWKTGNEAVARVHAKQALAAYELVNGTAACPDDADYPNPSARLSGVGVKLTPAEEREVRNRVCSVFLEAVVKRDRTWASDGLYLTKLNTVLGLLD